MSGNGLTERERYRVIIEIVGPKSKDEVVAFYREVEKFIKEKTGRVVEVRRVRP